MVGDVGGKGRGAEAMIDRFVFGDKVSTNARGTGLIRFWVKNEAIAEVRTVWSWHGQR